MAQYLVITVSHCEEMQAAAFWINIFVGLDLINIKIN